MTSASRNIHWRTSARCAANNGCVKLATYQRLVLVAGRKDLNGSRVLKFDRGVFAEFIRTVKEAPDGLH